MPQTLINIIRGDKISDKTDYRDALAVNMIAVPKPILGANGYMLCYPGLTSVATPPGTDRGAVYNDRFGVHFRVSGNKLIKVVGGVVTELGTVSGKGQVAMPYSFNSQCVIADGNMYLYDPVNGFSPVTDADLGSPIDAVWVDGYYFMTDGEYIFHTDLVPEASAAPYTFESTIDPLKFATAEFMPDRSLGVAKTQDNKVIVFGRNTIEYFVNAATEAFAFSRVANRAQKIGIVATHAKVEVDNTFYFVGSRKDQSLGVHILGVGSSVKISSREIDKILAQYTDLELADMRMETRMQDNVTFVLIHLPNECLCFNVEVAKAFGVDTAWCLLQTGKNGQAYRGINGIYDSSSGQWIAGDKYAFNLGIIDNTVFTQYGIAQEWYLFTPFINLETMSVDEMQVETIPGNNITDDAKVAMSTTTDGQNYNTEWWELYGQPLDYNHRFTLYRLGYVNQWIGFRLRGYTTSRMAFAGMKLTYG